MKVSCRDERRNESFVKRDIVLRVLRLTGVHSAVQNDENDTKVKDELLFPSAYPLPAP